MLTHGSLFSGIEGFGLGAALAGIKTVWSCELEDYQTLIIKKNFGEQHEINRDIRTYKNPSFVDIISGGFPCQDISIAGKGVGIIGERSGLWSEMFRIIRKVRPRYVLIENSPMLVVRGFEQVLCDLSEIGYDAEWQCLSGTDFGIQQNRERLYCIAYLRKQKKQIPADFRRQMYESYKANMAFFGKPASPYKQWLKDVFNTKIPTK